MGEEPKIVNVPVKDFNDLIDKLYKSP